MLQKKMLEESKIQKKRRTMLKVKNDFRFIRKNVSICLVKKKSTIITKSNQKSYKIQLPILINSHMMTEDLWHWISAVADWRKNVEERRSSKNGTTEAGKKTRDLNGAG